jgi:FtsP/CotA-like multicopper oxidase with cupredoxin domain
MHDFTHHKDFACAPNASISMGCLHCNGPSVLMRVRWGYAGTGYALLHCHILPHSDEGCIMKTQLLERT